MKKIYFLFLALLIITPASAGTTVTGSIVSGGITRTYRLYIPSIYNANNAPCPLILNMHGYTSNASDQQLYTNFMPIADTANFLMVYPQGTNDNTNTPFWNVAVNNGLVDDLGFLSHLIDTLSANYNIDLNRVYATGFSNGGFMSHFLGSVLNNKIAAVASVAGTFFTYTNEFPYNPGRAVPVMHIHGTSDPTVSYTGGVGYIGVDSTINFWVANNNCNSTPLFTAVPNTNTTDFCTAEHYVYNGGDNGTTIELFKIIGGAHSWPGAVNIGVTTNQDINASKEIWRFFSQYSLSTTTGIPSEKISGQFNLYPNPSGGDIQIELLLNQNENTTIKVFNSIGQEIINHNYNLYLGQNKLYLNMASYSKGIYFVDVQTPSNPFSKRIVVN